MIALESTFLHEVAGGRDDLVSRSKELAKDRKILRLVQDQARANFVCVLEIAEHIDGVAGEDIALFTVSEYKYAPPLAEDAVSTDEDELAQVAFKDNADPSGWLRGMPNSGICMLSITGGFQGPNLHLVGGGRSVGLAAGLASMALERGTAKVAILSAHSPGDGNVDDARAIIVTPSSGSTSLCNPIAWPELAEVDAYDALGRLHEALGSSQQDRLDDGDR